VAVATQWPVLVLLVVMALGALGSRAVVGWLSPGAYAEEVLEARAFLSARRLYHGDERAEFGRWLREEPAPLLSWTLPGVSECQASALEHRPQFYTSQAHSPVLLLASAPVVGVAGGRGLYVVLVALSLAGLGASWLRIVREMGLASRSAGAALAAVALAAWQPVVAGIRQGDAVLVAASLVVFSWSFARRERWAAAGVAAGLATVVAPAAAGAMLALARWPRAFGWACLTAGAATLVTVVVGGPMLLADLAGNVVTAARTYASAMPNYALAGRAVGGGLFPFTVAAAGCLGLTLAGWWRARSVDDSFALFIVLGLLAAPIAWSQHLALVLVPLVVLFGTVARRARSTGLAAWAALALVLSLPDPAVAHTAVAVGAGAWPLVPFALAALWAWLAARKAPADDGGAVRP
jgi:hypothetical protein